MRLDRRIFTGFVRDISERKRRGRSPNSDREHAAFRRLARRFMPATAGIELMSVLSKRLPSARN
jgi:hypothetical protein